MTARRMDTALMHELLELYGVVWPRGTFTRGDGSERCLVCGVRNRDQSWYVWAPRPFPICSIRHGERLLERLGDE